MKNERIFLIILIGIIVISLFGCFEFIEKNDEINYRPQIHFTPNEAWMNDPNGMIFYKGEYHLFYQHNPVSNIWGPMHWGHAISKDLIHWEHLPIALAPDCNGTIFSGSIVVDKNNTSGLFNKEGEGLVAIFTQSGETQQQSIAYSSDAGRTWIKFSENPVIKNTKFDSVPADFRDPKVFWYTPKEKWIMAISARNHIEFWSSMNLIKWTKESEFGNNYGSHIGVWECPDLFELSINGNNLEKKWVLIVSVSNGGLNGGSATQYFVGDFGEKNGKITYTSEQKEVKWIDYGTDNYAGGTWSNVIDKRYYIGWMSNWQYADKVPTSGWRGTMTFVRELELEKDDKDDVYICSKPLIKINDIKSRNIFSNSNLTFNRDYLLGKTLSTSLISAKINFNSSLNTGIELGNENGEKIRIVYDSIDKFLYLDRSKSSKILPFNGNNPIHKVYVDNIKDIDLEIILDRTSVEVFACNGKYIITDIIFPEKEYEIFKMVSDGDAKLGYISIDELK